MINLSNYEVEGQMNLFDLDIWCGKTCAEPLAPTVAKTSELSSKKRQGLQTKPPLFLNLQKANGVMPAASWEMGGLLLGVYTMQSFGEHPSVDVESRLSQILEANPHPKYCLSAKACQGILARAKRRGKELPPILEQTLIRQSAFKSELENLGGGKGLLIQNERTGALSTGTNQSVLNNSCLNPWDVQSKHIQTENGKAEALYSGECRYGGGESYVLNDGTGINGDVSAPLDASYYKGCGERAGIEREVVCVGNGQLCNMSMKPVANSLDCMHDQQAVMTYGICSDASNAMKSSNPHSGIYEADTARTLDMNGGNPSCNQGGMIVLEGNGARESHKGDGFKESEVMYTLNTVEQHAVCTGVDVYNQTTTGDKTMSITGAATDPHHIPCVCYGLDRASFNQGQNAQYDFSIEPEVAQTLVSKGPGGEVLAR